MVKKLDNINFDKNEYMRAALKGSVMCYSHVALKALTGYVGLSFIWLSHQKSAHLILAQFVHILLRQDF